MASPENDQGQAVPVTDEAPVALSPQVVEAYDSMLGQVPDAGADAGLERILATLAEASSPADLDAPWRSSGLEELAGIPLVVLSIRKMPSDFDGGLPWFLVVDAVNEVTGEKLTVTTGAVSVVAQLVKAHNLGAFPLRCRVVVADRPSKSGYFPQHLEMLTQPKVNAAAAAGS